MNKAEKSRVKEVRLLKDKLKRMKTKVRRNNHFKFIEMLFFFNSPAFIVQNNNHITVTVTSTQWSQNVGAGGPHHRPHQLMASFSLDCHRLVEWGRHNELEASMVGGSSSHILGSLHCTEVLIGHSQAAEGADSKPRGDGDSEARREEVKNLKKTWGMGKGPF